MKLKRAYSTRDLTRMVDPEGISLGPELDEAIGPAEPVGGTWFIYGPSKNGKTSMAMILAKALAKHYRVVYDSVEEGIRKTVRMAVERHGMDEVGRNFFMLDRELYDELFFRLKPMKRFGVVFIDSVQFMGLQISQYRQLKMTFPDKLFVFISHVKNNRGTSPEGRTALRIMQDSDVIFSVQGFKAFVTSRFGGTGKFTISEKMAEEFYVK